MDSWRDVAICVAGSHWRVVVVLCHNDGPLAIGNHRDFSDIDATVDLEVDFDLLGALDVLRADDPNVRL